MDTLQHQLKSATQAIRDQQFKTAVLLAETERLKGREVSWWGGGERAHNNAVVKQWCCALSNTVCM